MGMTTLLMNGPADQKSKIEATQHLTQPELLFSFRSTTSVVGLVGDDQRWNGGAAQYTLGNRSQESVGKPVIVGTQNDQIAIQFF